MNPMSCRGKSEKQKEKQKLNRRIQVQTRGGNIAPDRRRS
jgi:hypothetical protein